MAMPRSASICLDPAESPIEADLAAVGRSAFAGWVGYRRFCGAKADGLRVIGIAGGPQNARS